MAIMSVGLNAGIIATKSTVNQNLGQVLAELASAIERAEEAYAMFSAYADADLVALGFGDGTNGTPNELGYGIRTPLAAAHDLFLIFNGQAPVASQPQNYKAQTQYVTGTQG